MAVSTRYTPAEDRMRTAAVGLLFAEDFEYFGVRVGLIHFGAFAPLAA